MTTIFEHFMRKNSFLIIVINDNSIMYYFDIYFGFQNNLIFFFQTNYFRLKLRAMGMKVV